MMDFFKSYSGLISFGILTIITILQSQSPQLFRNGIKRIIFWSLVFFAGISQCTDYIEGAKKDQTIADLSTDTNAGVNDLKGEFQDMKNEFAGFKIFLSEFKLGVEPSLEEINANLELSEKTTAKNLIAQNRLEKKTDRMNSDFSSFQGRIKENQDVLENISKKQLEIKKKEIELSKPILKAIPKIRIDTTNINFEVNFVNKGKRLADSVELSSILLFLDSSGIFIDKEIFYSNKTRSGVISLLPGEPYTNSFEPITLESIDDSQQVYFGVKFSYFDQQTEKRIYNSMIFFCNRKFRDKASGFDETPLKWELKKFKNRLYSKKFLKYFED